MLGVIGITVALGVALTIAFWLISDGSGGSLLSIIVGAVAGLVSGAILLALATGLNQLVFTPEYEPGNSYTVSAISESKSTYTIHATAEGSDTAEEMQVSKKRIEFEIDDTLTNGCSMRTEVAWNPFLYIEVTRYIVSVPPDSPLLILEEEG